MGNWTIRWNFGKEVYSPGESGFVHFWLENTGSTVLFIDEVGLQFEWQSSEWFPAKCQRQIPVGSNVYIGKGYFDVPLTKAGLVRYRVGYHIWQYQRTTDRWEDLGFDWSELKYFIKSIPSPFYRAFVSRGIIPEDRLVGDQIVGMIKGWGFEPFTAGIEKVFEKGKVTEGIKEEIVKSNCLMAIATPRTLDALRGLWRTLEWLHGETGVAWGVDKPMLILKEKTLLLGGLPRYLVEEQQAISIGYDPFNLEELRTKLDAIMPSFRDWIASNLRDEFVNTLVKAATIAIPALLVGGIAGFLVGSSKR